MLSCALLAFSGNGDAKVGSAGGVALFLGVWLGLYGSLAVQGEIFEAIEYAGKDCKFYDECIVYNSLIMQLCGVIFGSIGCFPAVAALATTFRVVEASMGDSS